jgi:hypothetical protein
MSEADRLRARIEARYAAPPGDPLAVAKEFVKRYWADEGMAPAVQRELDRDVVSDRLGVERGVAALESLLAAPPYPRSLVTLVADEGNTPLDEATDAEAADWLRAFVVMAEAALRSSGDG